jgi:hypothetical protein
MLVLECSCAGALDLIRSNGRREGLLFGRLYRRLYRRQLECGGRIHSNDSTSAMPRCLEWFSSLHEASVVSAPRCALVHSDARVDDGCGSSVLCRHTWAWLRMESKALFCCRCLSWLFSQSVYSLWQEPAGCLGSIANVRNRVVFVITWRAILFAATAARRDN